MKGKPMTPQEQARKQLPMICRTLDFAIDLGEEIYSHELQEARPGMWQYGFHVPCVLVVCNDGSVVEICDKTAADVSMSDMLQARTYPSLQDWAGAQLIHTAEGYDHLNGSDLAQDEQKGMTQ